MSVRLAGPPTLDISPDGRLLLESQFGELWTAIAELSALWRSLDVSDYLDAWCGASPDDCTERLIRVHHVGIYLGDYDHEEEALAWNYYVEGLADDGKIRSVDVGPSYIAPKQYGTQGWLSYITLLDGAVLETFTCKRYGSWAERTIGERRALMSHAALEVRDEDDVRYVLDRLTALADSLEIIAFTEADEFGHTYGHIRNNSSSSVIEIVHQAPVTNDG
jgi:hypothetical protein